ncbi:hypothetical protein Nhal_2560 [Nitrosococcus halophilus Nc 4]|uniref:Uncharacterized protein n=1 Tax=Nitrosococcus halophilus (strain Nc4) TaxID=472759 RepID=D5BWI2_NITHN|nr:hypothetical protein [Nitrosococcus halophilus]ADE15639.1 hypothetical protein Nhal_2560 [Nitrosococcus halophilus Nc 4]
MHLEAVLTVGWPETSNSSFSARKVHQAAQEAEEAYPHALARWLDSGPARPTLLALERLFRRRPGGFHDLKTLIGTIGGLPEREAPLPCHIDCFAYAFLKGAKNFDFLLPEASAEESPFRSRLPEWNEAINALEELERVGQPLPAHLEFTQEDYLHLRHILARKSARDERRTLATLLVNGPSTPMELTTDLGLNKTLAQRILGLLANNDVVAARSGAQYVIREQALPLVVFGLRETLGLDLLSSLQPVEE